MSADATLSALAPNVGALIPVFAPNRTSYTLRVPSDTKSVTLTPTPSNAAASVQVSSVPVASGQPSPELKLPSDGSGLDIAIAVTAEDVLTTSLYKVHVALQAPPSALTVRSVGDSTMANYDPSASPNQRGWMQTFPQFTSGGVTVDNGGINGSSSKSYYLSGSWDIMKNKLNTGDYLFIQFGHNDEKDGGIEGKSNVGTAAWGAYHDYLTKYVDEARALGAIPILFTPVVRLSFAGASLTPIACHDLTGNGTAEGDANYPEAMRDVAKSTHAPLIDLTLATKALAEQYGPADAKALLYVSTDDTHLQVLGATAYAALAVQTLLADSLLTENLKPTLGLSLAENALDFGTRYLSTSLDRGFSLLGVGLLPEAGSVTLTAPDGFLVSTGTGAFGPTLELPYTRGALPPTTVNVRFQPPAARKYSAALTVGTKMGNEQSVALTGSALELPNGAVEAGASYALDSASAGQRGVPSGPLTCADESFSNLYLKGYAPLTTLLPAPTPMPTQQLGISSTPSADSWPAETDMSAERYVEFALTPAVGKSFSVDTVSFYFGGVGGPSFGFRAQLSSESDFSAPTELVSAADNATNTLGFFSSSPLVTVNAGQTLRLRIFPYSKAVATKKYLSLRSVTVHGAAY